MFIFVYALDVNLPYSHVTFTHAVSTSGDFVDVKDGTVPRVYLGDICGNDRKWGMREVISAASVTQEMK